MSVLGLGECNYVGEGAIHGWRPFVWQSAINIKADVRNCFSVTRDGGDYRLKDYSARVLGGSSNALNNFADSGILRCRCYATCAGGPNPLLL